MEALNASDEESMDSGRTELKIGCVLTGIIVFLAVLSVFWTPYDINYMDYTARLAAPSLKHIFGTDNLGRDIFSRAIKGGGYTLVVAVTTVAGCTVIR